MAGGGSTRGNEGKKKARIEIIPLIDVIFFLLATFVLFTLSLNKIQSVPLQLPQPQAPNIEPPDPNMVTLQVTDGGNYYWKVGETAPEPLSANELLPRLRNLKSTISNPKVLVTGDNHGKFGTAVFALDQIRAAKIDQVSVETRVTDTGK